MHNTLQLHDVEPTEAAMCRLATPKDVEAALTAGVRVIAVASGKSDEAELAQAGAAVIVSDLTHTATVVQLVTEGLQISAN